MLKYTIDNRYGGVIFNVREVKESDAKSKVATLDANEKETN